MSLWIMRNVLFWVGLWQTKEYRLDRLLAHLRETSQGRHLMFSTMSLIKWLLIFSYVFVALNDRFSMQYGVLVSILYILEGSVVFWEFFAGRLRRPVRTMKSLLIILMTLLMMILFVLLPMTDAPLWMLLIDRITVLIIALFVFFFAFPTEVWVDVKIQQAIKKLAHHQKLLVIAVSGSYGKSSTKEYIAQILKEKYAVVKTEGSNNTPVGVTMTILNKIHPHTQVFVVEMGAYKKGEIAQLCEIVRPDISVTTSVSDQHLSLFGTLENAMATEMELIHALPGKTGLALFNGNNPISAKLYTKTKKNKILYKSLDISGDNKIDMAATNTQVNKDGVSFDVIIKGRKQHFKTSLLGSHMVENILPGIYIAEYLKVSLPAIKKAVAHLIPPPGTMTRKELTNGVTLVDDTFNASPESVMAALKYMQVYDKKKIFVLTPLIELGKNAGERHCAIGRLMSVGVDYLFLTNNNFYKDIMKGIIEGNSKCMVQVGKPDQIAEEIIRLADGGDVVMFEGKEAGKVLTKLS